MKWMFKIFIIGLMINIYNLYDKCKIFEKYDIVVIF